MRERIADGLWWRIALIVVTVLRPSPASAQTASSVPLSLNDAVQLALQELSGDKGESCTCAGGRRRNRCRADRVSAPARHGLAGKPRHDEQCVRPAAPAVHRSSDLWASPWYKSLDDSVWGSAAGVLLSWEAIDFGQRKAGVDVARAQTALAKNQATLTELDVAAAAADAFLTVLAADEAVRATRANVDRLQVFADSRPDAGTEPAPAGRRPIAGGG